MVDIPRRFTDAFASAGGHARVEPLPTSGWCPFAARVLTARAKPSFLPDPGAVPATDRHRETQDPGGDPLRPHGMTMTDVPATATA